ncbi:MAG: GspE/PulE family protein [bacterium]
MQNNDRNKENSLNLKYRLGEILVSKGYINEEELQEALRVQKESKEYKPLGIICVNLGHISRIELSKLLRKYRKQIYIGELLVNMGLINGKQLDEVLEKQKESGKRIGELLIESGILTESQLVHSLSVQLGIPIITPDPCIIDQKLVLRFNEPFLRRQMALPAFAKENIVTLIMADPLSDEVINDFKKYFNAGIEPAIATSSSINRLLDILFNNAQNDTKEQKPSESELLFTEYKTSLDDEDDAVNIVNYIISSAISERASDIHIELQVHNIRIRIRVDGVLHHMTDLPRHLAPSIISRIKIMSGMDITEHYKHQEGHIESRILKSDIDLRVSVYPSIYGENIAIRILERESTLIDISELGFSPLNLKRFTKILDTPTGIILVCGPTGSGKTTTLYASLNYLNSMEKKIITVEDTVEYIMEGVVQGQLTAKKEMEYSDFVMSMKRQDPDVIMMGEILDAKAAQSIVNMALTGHKALSAFHTEDTTSALLRLIDMGIDPFLISSTIVSVIAQRLVRRICPHCREPYEPNPAIFSSFGVKNIDISKYSFYRGRGCDACHNTGFKGRVGIHEVLILNNDIRDAILQKRSSGSIRSISRKSADMVTLREDGFYKAVKGITTLEEVLRVVFVSYSYTDEPRNADEVIQHIEREKINTARGLPVASCTKSVGDEKEAYRIRFDLDNVNQDENRIRNLFREYQSLKRECGGVISDNLQQDFIDFIHHAIHQYKDEYEPNYIDFFLKIIRGDVRIFAQFQTYKGGQPLSSSYCMPEATVMNVSP